MKNLIALLPLILVLTSCGSDNLSESIIGSWEVSWAEQIDCGRDSFEKTDVDENGCLDIDGDLSCNISLEFAADGTWMFINEDGTDTGTYTTNDEQNTAELCSGSTCITAEVDGDKLQTINVIAVDSCTVTMSYVRS